MEKIKLYITNAGEFRFDLIAVNRAVIGTSGPYPSRNEAVQAVDLVKTLAKDDRRFRIYSDYSDKYFFSLQTEDGDRILISQGYSSIDAAKEGIEIIKQIAMNARMAEAI